MPRLTVSLSTLPHRMEYTPKVIESLDKQTRRPDKVVIYLCKADFSETPDLLKSLEAQYPMVEVRLINENYGIYTKLLPALKDFPEDILVNVDDDMSYEPKMIERLYAEYVKHPDGVITVGAKPVSFVGSVYRMLPVYQGFNRRHPRSPHSLGGKFGKNLVYLSGHGTLFPPHIFDDTPVLDYALGTKYCPKNDELWGWACLARKGTVTYTVPAYTKLFAWTLECWNPESKKATCKINTLQRIDFELQRLTPFIKSR